MRFFPVFVDLQGRTVVVSGAGAHAAAKIRLLLKTPADICVFGTSPCSAVRQWHEEGRLMLFERELRWEDVSGARFVYGANGDPVRDAAAVELGRWAGALTNIVDDLDGSDFLTPAIIDRDPVTVAIGTEGTAPVLARKIKSDVEELLPPETGRLARIAQSFRSAVATLKDGRARRDLWTRFFFDDGPAAFAAGGAGAAISRLHQSLAAVSAAGKQPGHVTFLSVDHGDPELLTLKARKALQHADMVFHDKDVAGQVLELARREADFRERQENDGASLAAAATDGGNIIVLSAFSGTGIGQFKQEAAALDAAGVTWEIQPVVTVAGATSASNSRLATLVSYNAGNIEVLAAGVSRRAAAKPSVLLRTGAN